MDVLSDDTNDKIMESKCVRVTIGNINDAGKVVNKPVEDNSHFVFLENESELVIKFVDGNENTLQNDLNSLHKQEK